jgi:hypothetical protein
MREIVAQLKQSRNEYELVKVYKDALLVKENLKLLSAQSKS